MLLQLLLYVVPHLENQHPLVCVPLGFCRVTHSALISFTHHIDTLQQKLSVDKADLGTCASADNSSLDLHGDSIKTKPNCLCHIISYS